MRITIAAVLSAAAVLAGGARAAPESGPTLADYGRLPSVSNVEISPDGSRIALLVGDEKRRDLQVRDAATLALLFGGELGEAKVRALQWAGAHHLLITTSGATEVAGLSGGEREYLQLEDLDVDHKKIRPLMRNVDRGLNTISGPPVVLEQNGKPVVFVEGTWLPGRQGVRALFRIDLEGGRQVRVEDGDEHVQRYVVGPDGRADAIARYEPSTGRWRLDVRTSSGWKEAHRETAEIETPVVEGLGPDGRSVLVRTLDGRSSAAHEASLTDASWSAPLEALQGKTAIADPLTHRVIGGRTSDMGHTVYTFLSPQDQAAWDAVARAFPNEELQIQSWSDDRRRIIVKAEGARDGAAFFRVDLSTGKADWLVDEYAAIGSEAVAERRVVTYAASDGVRIPAYLTLPKGRPARDLPLIVLVHGGPAVRDEPGFDWWSQALASRGYAVLQPQYRGSNGFGEAFLAAGFGQWGRKMQTDLSDGVRALARSGAIDPKRVCIMGASYGGYAALAGAVFDAGVYRCAVALAGPSDLRRMLSWLDDQGSTQNVLRYWDRFMGARTSSDRALDDISPALHADRAAAPILLIHGKDDTVVPYAQSEEMAAALKRAGKPVEFVTLKGEDHWLSHSETRLQMLTAAVAFVEAHNPPAPAATLASSGSSSEPAFQVFGGPTFETFATATEAACPKARARYVTAGDLAGWEEEFMNALPQTESARVLGATDVCEGHNGLSCPASRNLDAIAKASLMDRFVAFVCARAGRNAER